VNSLAEIVALVHVHDTVYLWWTRPVVADLRGPLRCARFEQRPELAETDRVVVAPWVAGTSMTACIQVTCHRLPRVKPVDATRPRAHAT
jgi:hypothetical protein